MYALATSGLRYVKSGAKMGTEDTVDVVRQFKHLKDASSDFERMVGQADQDLIRVLSKSTESGGKSSSAKKEPSKLARVAKGTIKYGSMALGGGIVASAIVDHAASSPQEIEASEILKNHSSKDVHWETASDNGIAILNINYQLVCKDDATKKYVDAHLQLEDGTIIRTHLFWRKNTMSIVGGAIARGQDKTAKLFISNANADCEVKNVQLATSTVNEGDQLNAMGEVNWDIVAKLHTPRIVIRHDQYTNPDNDIALQMKYALKETPTGKRIVYVLYMSEEDSLKTAKAIAGQNGVWGRSLDIERVVVSDFDHQGKLQKSVYQGFLHFDRELVNQDKTCSFPTVYNVANNNIFSDRAKDVGSRVTEGTFRTVGRIVAWDDCYDTHEQRKLIVAYHPALGTPTVMPTDRSEVPLIEDNEWMLEVSDDEMRAQNKIPSAATENLYVIFDGKFSRDSINSKLLRNRIYAALEVNGKRFVSGGYQCGIKKFGCDMWEQQGGTAISLPKDVIADIASGKVDLKTALRFDQLNPEANTKATIVRAYIVNKTAKGYKSQLVFGK